MCLREVVRSCLALLDDGSLRARLGHSLCSICVVLSWSGSLCDSFVSWSLVEGHVLETLAKLFLGVV